MSVEVDAIAKEVLSWMKEIHETVSDQAPILAREIRIYGIVSNAAWLIGLSLAAYLPRSFGLWRRLIEEYQKPLTGYADDRIGQGIALGLAALGTVVLIFCAAASLQQMLLALFAPRLYVLRALAQLVAR